MAATLDFQVTVDCDDPHAQARFWAAALGYVLEVDTAFVQRMLDEGAAERADVVELDGDLFWRIGAAIAHPDGIDDVAAKRRAGNAAKRRAGNAAKRRAGSRLLFLAVPDRDDAKNAWHLDLNVGEDRIEAEVERLTALGALERYRMAEHGSRHVTMADPEGNLFCIQ